MWEADSSRDVLERIGALLFALADLADLAAGAPYRRRRQVIAILSYGEAEARAFVIGLATGAPMPIDEPSDGPETAGDAARLAARLRALGLVLYALMARRPTLPGAQRPRACRPSHEISTPAVRQPADSASPAPDTS